MLDFGALPPEINSARMYSGPGSGPMMAAASAWDALAAQLELFALGYASVLADLQDKVWSGDASSAMSGAVARYVYWTMSTAAQAEQSAAQARASAAAFDAAFAATVPPVVVMENRVQLGVLIATNFFGQNTPAIAVTEAAYAEMWAQDATALYGYAASVVATSALKPFTQPPPITAAGGESAQAAALVQALVSPGGLTQATLSPLSGISTGSAATEPSAASLYSSALTAFSAFDTLVVSPAQPFWSTTYAVFSTGQFGTGLNLSAQAAAKAAATTATSEATVARPAIRGPVLVNMGEATAVGKLSVPAGWPTATSVGGPSPAQPAMPAADFRTTAPAQSMPTVTNSVGAVPAALGRQRDAGTLMLRNGRRVFKMPRPLYGG